MRPPEDGGWLDAAEDLDEELDAADEGEDENVEPSDLPVEDEVDGATAALLPDGSTLTLTGPGAGRSRDAAPADGAAIRIRDRDASLDVGSLVLYHRPRESAGDLPRLLAAVAAATRGRVALGAVTALPLLTPIKNREWHDSCAAAGVHIADPLCFKLDPDMGQRPYSGIAQRHWPGLLTDPSNITNVVRAQREAGANLLLTSGRMLAMGDPQRALDDACAEGDNALALLERGERLALNLTLPTEWLTNTTLRGLLLDQLLDQEQFDIWYIRVLWPTDPPHPVQPTRVGLIEGYKRLAQLADDEDRKLLLPQTGLTGWLQLAFGATGFGTSPTGSGQSLRRERGGGGGFPPVERYFEPGLLHVVERSTHDALLRATGYVRCTCPYCPALHSGAAWNHQLSRLHHAYWCGRLADPGSRPAGVVRRTVRAALRESTRLAPVLTGSNAPAHLQAWDRFL